MQNTRSPSPVPWQEPSPGAAQRARAKHVRVAGVLCVAVSFAMITVFGVPGAPEGVEVDRPAGGCKRRELEAAVWPRGVGVGDACPVVEPRLLTADEAAHRVPGVLFSFPGSGNSFLRVLLEQASGYLTGSVYHLDAIMNEVFPGETSCGADVLAVKAHHKITDRCAHVAHAKRVVVLLRHPFKAMFAEYNRKYSVGPNRHILGVARAAFDARNFTETLDAMAGAWVEQYTERQASTGTHTYHHVYFEDLVSPSKAPAAVRGVLAFLGVCGATEAAARCAAARATHPLLKRVHQEGDIVLEEVMTPDVVNRVWKVVGPTAEVYGYSKTEWASYSLAEV